MTKPFCAFLLCLQLILAFVNAEENPNSFNEALICGGTDIEDKFKYKFNISGQVHCFFDLPYHNDTVRVIGDNRGGDTRRSMTSELNGTAARIHCARYGATLPVIDSAAMFWAVSNASLSIGGPDPMVPLGMHAWAMEGEQVAITWDNGIKTNLNVSGTLFPATEDHAAAGLWLWARGGDSLPLEGQPWFHVSLKGWDIDFSNPRNLIILCHQNLAKLRPMLTSAGTMMNQFTSAVSIKASTSSAAQPNMGTKEITLMMMVVSPLLSTSTPS